MTKELCNNESKDIEFGGVQSAINKIGEASKIFIPSRT